MLIRLMAQMKNYLNLGYKILHELLTIQFPRINVNKDRLWPDLQTFVVVILVSLYAITIMLLLLKPITITGEAGTLLTALTGLLTGKVATIVDFYFGTSKSNSLKDETVKSLAETVSPQSTSKVEVTTTETMKG